MVFSTATIVAIFFLATELLGAAGGLAAAFLMAASPGGRVLWPHVHARFADAVLLGAGVLGVRTVLSHGQPSGAVAGQRGDDAWRCLIKVPARADARANRRRRLAGEGQGSLPRSGAVALAAARSGLVTVAWYSHAFLLYRQTGSTFGILVHPARTYPLDIAPGPWSTAFSKWSSWRC